MGMGIENGMEKSVGRFVVWGRAFRRFPKNYRILVLSLFWEICPFNCTCGRLEDFLRLITTTNDNHPPPLSYLQSLFKLDSCSLHDSHRHHKHGMHKRHAILFFVLRPFHLLRRRR